MAQEDSEMETMQTRVTELFPSVLLTVLSMIQALALGAVLIAIAALAHQIVITRRYWEHSMSGSDVSEAAS
jgi:hypothetical protein